MYPILHRIISRPIQQISRQISHQHLQNAQLTFLAISHTIQSIQITQIQGQIRHAKGERGGEKAAEALLLLVDHSLIKIRRLFNPDKSVIISIVSPDIFNDSVTVHLKNSVLSSTSHINTVFNIIEQAHILCFRRQVYISLYDFQKFPNYLLINSENTHHRIFFSEETLTFHKCKRTGHTSTLCNISTVEAPNTLLNESPDSFNTASNIIYLADHSTHNEHPLGIPVINHFKADTVASNILNPILQQNAYQL